MMHRGALNGRIERASFCALQSALARFWSRVDKSPGQGPHGQCWTWIGSCDSRGYGQLSVDGHSAVASQLGWIIQHGRIPDGLWVLHQCDNRKCVRCLYLGTPADNVRDAEARGQAIHPRGLEHGRYTKPEATCRGVSHPKAKLDAVRVIEIRQRATTVSISQLAREYGLSRTSIQRIITREHWRHVA